MTGSDEGGFCPPVCRATLTQRHSKVSRVADGGARSGVTARACLAIFLIGLAARAGWGLASRVGAEGAASLRFPDEQQYWAMAQSLRSGVGLRDELGFRATRMPLYPGYLAVFPDTPAGLRAALFGQWIVGALAGPLVAVTAWKLFRRTGAAWIAGLLIALDPFLVYFASLALTETFSVTLIAALGLLGAKLLVSTESESGGFVDWIPLGITSALSVYARESTLGLILLLFGAITLCGRRRRGLGGAMLALGIVALSLAPWAMRNKLVIGQWRWLTTRGGISLYDGVRPGATGASDLGDVKAAPEVSGLDEVGWDDWFRQRSREAIMSDPAHIARLGVVKLARVWNPVPNVEGQASRAIRWISASWALPTFALAMIGVSLLLRGRDRRMIGTATLLILPAIYFSLLHCVFVGSVRYRLGALPGIAVLAACAVTTLVSRPTRSGSEAPTSG